MNLQLPELEIACGPNLGGLNIIKVIPVGQVVSIPEPVGYEIASPLVYAAGAAPIYLAFPDAAGEFTENQASNEHGDFLKQKLSVFIPKDSPAIANWSSKLMAIKWCIVEYLDNNGRAKVIGSLDTPLDFSADLETGKAFNNKNGHTFSFYGESLHKAYFYQHFFATNSPAPQSLIDWDPRDWDLRDWN